MPSSGNRWGNVAYLDAFTSNLFGDSVVGEYFRAFLSYGVIAVALILYAWRSIQQKKSNLLQQAGR